MSKRMPQAMTSRSKGAVARRAVRKQGKQRGKRSGMFECCLRSMLELAAHPLPFSFALYMNKFVVNLHHSSSVSICFLFAFNCFLAFLPSFRSAVKPAHNV
jgi:hypothetical protein